MIAARFRLVGWVAGCAGAALCCYMASQSVAAERSALARVDSDIVKTQADIDRLTTEVTARSRAGQLEKWNYTLALQAAKPAQYVSSGIQLASLAGGKKLPLDPAILASRGAVQTVAYQPQAAAPAPAPVTEAPAPAPKPVVVQTMPVIKAAPTPKLVTVAAHVDPAASPLLHQASFVRAKPSRLADDGDAAPLLHTASLEKIAPKDIGVKKTESKPAPKVAEAKAAKAKPKLAKLDDGLLPSDLGKLIAAEGKAKPAKRTL